MRKQKNIQFAPPFVGREEIEAVTRVIKSGWLGMGPETIAFEKEFAEYCGAEHAIAVNSCTSGLFFSLLTLNLKQDDEVITTPFTFAATANIIEHAGAKVIFADIDPNTLNIDPKSVEQKITAKTRACIVVHYGGQIADMDSFRLLEEQHNIVIIEDAAHAAGSRCRDGSFIGGNSQFACFSFYPTKPLATGDGGIVTTNNQQVADRLRSLRLHGITKEAWNRYTDTNSPWSYDVTEPGYKGNMNDIEAAIGRVQLSKLNRMNEARRDIAALYQSGLQGLPIAFPQVTPQEHSSRHLFPILVDKTIRDILIQKLKTDGIPTSVHFIPLHLMTYYKTISGYVCGDFPHSESTFSRIISLPIHPSLNQTTISYIIERIRSHISDM